MNGGGELFPYISTYYNTHCAVDKIFQLVIIAACFFHFHRMSHGKRKASAQLWQLIA